MVIAPNDGELFSRQATALLHANEDDAIGLLVRTTAQGDGNTLFNLAAEPGGPAARSWVQVDYHDLDAESGASQTGFTARASKVQAGVDWTVADTGRLGVAVSHDNAWLHDSLGSRGRSDVGRLGIYGSQVWGRFGLSAMLGYTHSRDDAWRVTGIGDAVSRRDTEALTAGLQAALPFQLGAAQLTPVLGVVETRLSGDSFQEHGDLPAAFAISGESQSETVLTPYAKLALSRTFEGGGIRWTPDVQVGYRHSRAAFGQRYLLIASDGTGFDGNRAELDGDVAEAAASLTASKDGWTLFLTWRGQWADHWNDQQGQLGLRVAF